MFDPFWNSTWKKCLQKCIRRTDLFKAKKVFYHSENRILLDTTKNAFLAEVQIKKIFSPLLLFWFFVCVSERDDDYFYTTTTASHWRLARACWHEAVRQKCIPAASPGRSRPRFRDSFNSPHYSTHTKRNAKKTLWLGLPSLSQEKRTKSRARKNFWRQHKIFGSRQLRSPIRFEKKIQRHFLNYSVYPWPKLF